MELILSSLIMSLFCAIAYSVIVDKKLNVQNLILVVLLYATFLTISYNFMNIARFFLSVTVLSTINYIFFKEKLLKTIVITFMIFVIVAISEIIVMLFLIEILKLNIEVIVSNYYGKLVINIFIFLISLFILKFSAIYKILRSKLEIIELEFGFKFYLLFLLAFINFSLLIHYIYFDGSKTTLIVLYFCSIVFSTLLFLVTVVTKNEREIIKSKYKESMMAVTEYEEHLEKMRIINHENVNNLVIIKEMVDDTKVKAHIGSILGENSDLANDKLQYLPSGGIRGIVAQKMDICVKKDIQFDLYVQKGLNVIKKDDVCRLLGIYLDNAIDAASESSIKKISIGFYKKEITISNTYTGYIDHLRMNDKGFSSKGKGRGYGLYLASKIIKESGIVVEQEISDVYKLKIKSF